MWNKELGLQNPMEDRIQNRKAINKGLGAGPQDPTQKDLWKEFSRLEPTLRLMSHMKNMCRSSLGNMGGNT